MSTPRSLIVFLIGMPLSFAYNSYCDAKDAVYKYRNNKLDDYDKKRFYNEESYVRNTMIREFPPNLLMASIWPITLPMSFIPSLALMMNPPKEK
jgi:hypothetical protein